MDSFNLLFFTLLLAIMYFFFIRPQARRQKAQQKFLEEMAVGDEVVTGSGILGKVLKIDGNVITLQVDNKTSLRVTKSAISKEMTDGLYASKDKKA